MGKKYKILYDREKCIGAGSCVAVADHIWKMDDEDKATLLEEGTEELELVTSEMKKTPEIEEAVIDEKDLDVVIQSAEVCPVQVIKIIDIETGEELV